MQRRGWWRADASWGVRPWTKPLEGAGDLAHRARKRQQPLHFLATAVPGSSINFRKSGGNLVNLGDVLVLLLAHLPQRVQRAEADVEVAAGEDQQEWDTRPAALIRLGQDATLVPEADPQARRHVAS